MHTIDSRELSVIVAGKNTASGSAGVDVGPIHIGARIEEEKTDYRSCLDAIAKYNGKVSECAAVAFAGGK